MRVILTGASGLLGEAIWEVLRDSYQVIPLSLSGKNDTIRSDLRDGGRVAEIVNDYHPDIIIHSAAITDVELCEKEPKLAHEVNANGTRNLTWYASKINSAFIYISTDYVFNGEKGSPYTEEDEPDPLNVYGISKLAGEKYVSYFMEEYFILRTSLLYGANRSNPVRALLEGLQQGKEVLAASDQFISPTYVVDFARALKEFLSQLKKRERKEVPYGIYHLANSGACSRYQFASKVAELSGFDSKQVKDVLLEEIPKVARRPKFSALSSEKFEQFASFKMRSWQSALEDYLSNFKR